MSVTELERPARPPVFHHLSTGRKARNHLATVLVSLAFLIALVPLVWLLATVVVKGWRALVSPDWFTHSLKGVLPDQFAGGIYHALYGSLAQALVCAVIAVPIGILAAIYLVEYGRGWLARLTTFMVDILSGVPSIVAALFIFALWISTFGLEQSAFAVSLALVLLMLPVVVRSTEEMLRLVPQELREASYALGIPKWKTIVRVVLPTALSGIVTGSMLALARVLGETAPVLVLVGYSQSINFNIFDGNMTSLPLFIYNQFTNPTEAGQLRIWGAALTLILLVMLFNLIATVISRFSAIKTK
ncbi:phosphate ABC transporter permease PstA [Sciscionella sediminilitoris]|uniref:phosphate ABC transporter permease PstA n=1 Tax=Sciscionella sediminilitoris TaxID=1445613 RepID=UPI0004DF0E09|nr:phosphate ABC transporter permease PstA [Sciscionella sp. SE31]